MAFYKKFETKTPNQRRSEAFARGGFDTEGSHYRKNGSAGRSAAKPFNGKGEHRQSENRPQQGFGNSRYDNKNTNRSGRFNADASRRFKGQPSRNPRMQDAAPQQKEFEKYRFQPQPRMEPKPAPVAVQPVEVEEVNENLLTGRNPIREALKTGRDIEKLMVARGELSGSAREIVEMAKERRIPVQEVDRSRLDSITRNHQGMLAYASAYQYSSLEDMFELAKKRNEAPFLIVLDRITDPHNLGAIIRSAECAGAHGVIVQERRAVGLTPAAVKASAGAVEYLPVARVTNLSNTIELLKKKGLWIYAADMGGEDYASADLSGAVALVIGAEGSGVGSRVMQQCDKVISLPMRGHIDSLNASVAAGILMYAVRKARS